MKISLTKAQILERCRIDGGLEPLRSDCTIEYTDGIDVDTLLLHRLRSRYLEMLDTAPLRHLAPEEVTPVSASGVGVRMSLPQKCRRVVDVALTGWTRAVEVLPPSMLTAVLSWQENPYRAATTDFPIAVADASGDILAWPAGEVAVIHAVCDPGESVYVLDETGLEWLIQVRPDNFQT